MAQENNMNESDSYSSVLTVHPFWPHDETMSELDLRVNTGCKFLGKTRKTIKCIGQKNPKSCNHCWQKTENQRLNWRKTGNCTSHQNKPQILSAKTTKPN